MALALANRSAVLVHVKDFATAIRDIQLSLQSGYATSQRYKLYERMAYCHQQLHQFNKAATTYAIAVQCLDQSDLNQSPQQMEKWRNNLNRSLNQLSTLKEQRKVKHQKLTQTIYRSIKHDVHIDYNQLTT